MSANSTVLIVDDELSVLKLMEIALKRAGYRVFAVSDGREALRLFRQIHHDVDIAILDGLMPGMSGPDVLSALREASPELPVLFVSGFVAKRELKAMGSERIMKKPFEAAALVRAVGDVLAATSSTAGKRSSRVSSS